MLMITPPMEGKTNENSLNKAKWFAKQLASESLHSRDCSQNQKNIQGITFHTKDRHKMCDHQFSKSQKLLSKTNKVFRALLSTQKTATKCVIIQKKF